MLVTVVLGVSVLVTVVLGVCRYREWLNCSILTLYFLNVLFFINISPVHSDVSANTCILGVVCMSSSVCCQCSSKRYPLIEHSVKYGPYIFVVLVY